MRLATNVAHSFCAMANSCDSCASSLVRRESSSRHVLPSACQVASAAVSYDAGARGRTLPGLGGAERGEGLDELRLEQRRRLARFGELTGRRLERAAKMRDYAVLCPRQPR